MDYVLVLVREKYKISIFYCDINNDNSIYFFNWIN